MPELTYNIVKTLLVFPKVGKNHKELNLIEWGNNKAKYDLRAWNDDRSEMTKGITLSEEELLILKEGLGGLTL